MMHRTKIDVADNVRKEMVALLNARPNGRGSSRSPKDGSAGPGRKLWSGRSERAWIGSCRLQRARSVRRIHTPALHTALVAL
jgi:hypothetical protein